MWMSPERTPPRAAALYLRAMAPTLGLNPADLETLHQRVDY